MSGARKALVLGMYGENALGVVRSLGFEGIPIAGFHLSSSYPHAACSRYVSSRFAFETEDELLEGLLSFGRSQEEKAVVFCTGDYYAELVQRMAEELEPFYILPLSGAGDISELIDKSKMLGYAQQAGFQVPEHSILSSDDVFDIKYPVIIKPLNSINGSKRSMEIFETPSQLRDVRGSLLAKGDMEVQSFVPGPVQNQVEAHTYLSRSGEVIFGGMLRYFIEFKVPQLKTLMSSVDQSAWYPEIVGPAANLTRILEFMGALDINLKIGEEDDKVYFYEYNLRTSANLALDTLAGINLPALIFYDQAGRDYQHLIKGYKQGLFWISDMVVGLSLMQGFISVDEILKMSSDSVFSVFDKEDPVPYHQSMLAGKCNIRY